MNPVTYFLLGWTVANADTSLTRKERAAVTLACVVPDIDGFGLVAEVLTRGSDHELLWWSKYHHTALHNLTFALVVAAASFALTWRRWRTALLAFLGFHVHILGDIVGPEGLTETTGLSLTSRRFQTRCSSSGTGNGSLTHGRTLPLQARPLLLPFTLHGNAAIPCLRWFLKGSQAFVQTLRNRFPL